MGLFGFGKSSKRIQGSIGYFGLAEWWLSAFSDDERHHIQSVFQPIGASSDSLTSGKILDTNETVVRFLGSMATWFNKEEDRAIAHKILDKAIELSSNAPVIDVHFLYQQMIQTYYKDRDDPEYLEKAMDACRRQIDLAPEAARAFRAEYGESTLPVHKGYTQLAIILEKQGRFQDAIDVCLQAKSQGWSEDWDRRIARYEKKLNKA